MAFTALYTTVDSIIKWDLKYLNFPELNVRCILGLNFN